MLFSGCARPTEVPSVTPEPVTPVSPAQTDTPIPTTATDRLLLIDPAGQASVALVDYLTNFTRDNGLVLETSSSPELPPQQANTKVVIFLAEPANLVEIAAASPQTQFIVSGAVELKGIPNLSVIYTKTEDLVFMGGYLAMLISWDWRTGGLLPSDTVMAAEKANAFENGARFVCGQCTPYYAPLAYFPLLGLESAQAGVDAWAGQITILEQNAINTFYVDPAIAAPEVLDRLIAVESVVFRDVYLVGLAGTALPERFTALVGMDILPALQQILPEVAAGNGGREVTARVKVVTINDSMVVTPGKIENFDRIAADLATGFIVPLNIP